MDHDGSSSTFINHSAARSVSRSPSQGALRYSALTPWPDLRFLSQEGQQTPSPDTFSPRRAGWPRIWCPVRWDLSVGVRWLMTETFSNIVKQAAVFCRSYQCPVCSRRCSWHQYAVRSEDVPLMLNERIPNGSCTCTCRKTSSRAMQNSLQPGEGSTSGDKTQTYLWPSSISWYCVLELQVHIATKKKDRKEKKSLEQCQVALLSFFRVDIIYIVYIYNVCVCACVHTAVEHVYNSILTKITR